MGIEQLVEAFKTNPQPLEEKVQKDQQGQKPGELTPDMEEALALQKIKEIRTGAQNQQAMQAGGPQQTILEKLRQMVAGSQQQAQPPQMPQGAPQGMPQQQGQPVMAARGGSITDLVSNLARHYAGGGIVAFSGETDSDVKDESLIDRYSEAPKAAAELGVPVWAYKQAADFLARTGTNATVGEVAMALAKQGAKSAGSGVAALGKGAVDLAKLAGTGPGMAVLAGGIPATQFTADVMGNNPKLREAYTDNYMLGAMDPDNALGAAIMSEAAGTTKSAQKQKAAADADPEVEKLKRLAAARAQTGVNTNPALKPRPTVNPSAGGGGGRASAETGERAAPEAPTDPTGLRAIIEANIRKELGKDEDQEWQKGSKRYEDFVGIDKLLQPREARIAEREAMLKKMQGERTPTWVEALSAAGRPVRGGLGTLLNQMGSAAESTRKGYSAEDLKFFDDIGAMKDEVAKLKLEGKYKAAAAGEASIKDAIANKRQAESSGTSLIATDERTETSKQIAKDNAAARLEAAKLRGAGSGDKQQLAELKALQTSLKDQLKEPKMMGKAGDDLRRQLAAINAEIAKMAGISTMAPAPGAGSPGGTRPPLSSFQR